MRFMEGLSREQSALLTTSVPASMEVTDQIPVDFDAEICR